MKEFDIIGEFGSDNRGLYQKDTLILPFKNETEVKENHKLYLYVSDILDNGHIALKFGKADKTLNIYNRYKQLQDIIKPYNKCIWLGDSEFGDEYGHEELKKRGQINKMYRWIDGEMANHSDENYEMLYGVDSIYRFIKDLEEIYNTKDVKIHQALYQDIFDSVKEIFLNNEKWNILYFCPRAGKTRTNLSLMQLHNMLGHRISIMFSYVGTVRNSYISDINSIDGYETIKFIDLSEVNNIKKTIKEINDWLINTENHVMLYFALTGDTNCYNKRKQLLNKLNQYQKVAFIEEADFGAHCDNDKENGDLSQLTKIKTAINNYNVENVYITTGTGYEKILKFIKGETYKVFTKDYFIDILCKK